MSQNRCVPALLALALTLCAGAVTGQTARVQLTPYAGAFAPTGHLPKAERVSFEPEGVLTERFDSKHETAIAIGARATFWMTRAIGMEGAFAYTPSSVRTESTRMLLDAATGTVLDTALDGGTADANLWALSARLIYRLNGPGRRTTVHLLAGPALVGRGGDAYGARARTDLGGAVGAGLVVGLTHNLGLRLDVEDYIYSFESDSGDSEDADSELQNDLVVSAGLTMTLGR